MAWADVVGVIPGGVKKVELMTRGGQSIPIFDRTTQIVSNGNALEIWNSNGTKMVMVLDKSEITAVLLKE